MSSPCAGGSLPARPCPSPRAHWRPTRRRHPVALVALALAVLLPLLAACGSSSPSTTAGPDAGATPVATGSERQRVDVADDSGTTVSVDVPVASVAVFNTFNVEFIRAVGAMDAVVGIDEGAAKVPEYWDGFATTVGKGQAEPNYEQLAALAPEVVIFPRNGAFAEARQKLEPFGIKVVVITGWDQDQHVQNVERIGTLFGRPAAAADLNAFYTRWRDELVRRLDGVARPPVYLENEAELTSPVPGSGWHQMIELAGGRNIFGDVDFGAQTSAQGSVHAFPIQSEAVVERAPSLVVKLSGGQYRRPEPGSLDALRQSVAGRPGWSGVPAVTDDRVVATSSFPMNACSKIIGSLYLASWLHPDRMAGVDPDAVMTEWITRFQQVPLDQPSAYRSASDRVAA